MRFSGPAGTHQLWCRRGQETPSAVVPQPARRSPRRGEALAAAVRGPREGAALSGRGAPCAGMHHVSALGRPADVGFD